MDGVYFFAIALPEGQKESLVALQDRRRGFSWSKRENLHLTLRFAGRLETEQVERLAERIRVIRVCPFILPLEGVGVFPPRGAARVIWVGIGNAHPRLFQLRQLIDDSLLRLGWDSDLRTFHPHVTIARIRDEASFNSVAEWTKRWRNFQGAPFRVDSVILYNSIAGKTGVEYQIVETFTLI